MKSIITIALCLLYATSVFAANAATVTGDLTVSGTVYTNGTPLTSPDKLTRYRSTWQSQNYVAGDIVQYQGSLYIATSPTTTAAPPNAAWSLLSAGATPIDYSGTYIGNDSDIESANNGFGTQKVSTTTNTMVITQTGSTFTGTLSLGNGMQGTLSGIVNGNILTFSDTFSSLPQGCSSIQVSGLGFITNGKFTYFYSGIANCTPTNNYMIGSGILTKQ